ncbi:hypothetical protein MSAN_00320000 [Mycena sanguinolenta]|uniref:Uncharacterized protein n=1 Tax=Mycena sanguinolenta TaxID=230812 RepID=A0A8H6ZEV6_9AGAR|nr:hypothetical protein MSAN_00320000 [Mycena sanguinolenta]
MASVTPALPAAQLCDYCHQRPKNGTHSYCSKTCAAQTATLCNYCKKKPKYQNFDFCGKNCAASAAAAGMPAGGNRSANGNTASTQPSSKPAGRPNAAPQAPTNSLLDPIQLAKLVAQHIPQVAQHIPQVQSLLAAVTPSQPAAQAPPPVSAPNPAPAPANPQPKPPRNNPFLNTKQPPAPNAPAAPVSSGTAAAPERQRRSPGPGAAVGVSHPRKHREYAFYVPYLLLAVLIHSLNREAVASGIVPPCIMCLTLPQSDTDYFCSKNCREEAMTKLGP